MDIVNNTVENFQTNENTQKYILLGAGDEDEESIFIIDGEELIFDDTVFDETLTHGRWTFKNNRTSL